MNDIESLRQEAESLKNQIRVRTLRPKDDQTMMDFLFSLGCSEGSMWCYSIASSTKCRSDWSYSNAYTTNSSRSSCQNLCYALGIRCQVNSRQTRFRKVSTEIFFFFFSSSSRNLVSASQDGKLIVWDSYTTNKVCKNEELFFIGMNLFLIKKGSRYSPSFVMGHDMCLCAIRKFCCLWWSWQYLFNLFIENTWRQCTCYSRITRSYGIFIMLSFSWWFSNCYKFRRYDMVSDNNRKIVSIDWVSLCVFLVLCGILKLDNKQLVFKDIQVMLCHFHYHPIWKHLFRALAMPRLR